MFILNYYMDFCCLLGGAMSTSLYYQNGGGGGSRPYIIPHGSISYSDIDWGRTLLNSSTYQGGYTISAAALANGNFFGITQLL